MPSFDIVSKVQWNEVDNALNQAQKEISQRYDFKDTETELERNDEGIVLRSSSADRVKAALVVLQEKLVRRKVSLKSLEPGDIEKTGKGGAKILVAGHVTDVAIERGGDLIVVAGAEVHVALKALGFAADDQAELGVRLEALDPIDDLDAGVLERAGPFDIARLIEAGLLRGIVGDQIVQARELIERVRAVERFQKHAIVRE